MMLSETNLQLLQSIPMFRDIEREEVLSRLANNFSEVEFPAGYTIFKQGGTGSFFYILISGVVQVHLGGLQLAQLEAGAYFGEMSIFAPEPHSVSVTTLSACKCLVLTQEQIYELIKENPEIGVNIIRVLAGRVRVLNQQFSACLRGFLTIAWADGEYNEEEKEVIENLLQDNIYPDTNLGSLHPISATELAVALHGNKSLIENFVRTAVIVALANGTYSESEDKVLREFCTALLGQKLEILEALRVLLSPETLEVKPQISVKGKPVFLTPQDVLQPVRNFLDDMEIDSPYMARFLCKMIPPQCPFERDIVLFGHKVIHIPPMCKLNPLYEQLVGLRFRALSYLADECKEDISQYI
ncbi:Mo-dependent nitrogenase C-terminal domain-containing protein [Floridanema aerugineum]|jgi:tellurite resistance protein|uniref:Mo-dependent nitrogenase C-terminal domain-containing protein n=1 Tax=Floridaenema aerugineum BLCC-F46 TaxID=3153654 RepID=A0ABV4XAY9_9CYAN